MEQRVTVRLEDEVIERLKALAKQDKRTVTQYIRVVLENLVEQSANQAQEKRQ
jgi:predicted DNA-binding protein